MRSAQALFSPMEVLLQCYVDDPLALLSGDEATRRTNAAVLLLWWRALGPGISWGKVEAGRSVNWIGATLALSELDADVVEASLPPAFTEELRQEVAAKRAKPMVMVDDLRRMAGKGSWAANVGPTLRNFLQPLWKVIGDVDRANRAQPSSAKGKEAKRRLGKKGGTFVETRRVHTALDWLNALLSKGQRSTLKRSVNWKVELSEPSLVITCDASPWGLGAVLSTPSGLPLAWLSSEVTEQDAKRLGIKRGEAAGQAVLEALAILVAVRQWASVWAKAKARVHVRSDSMAALGALGKVSSPVPSINSIAREIAIDVTLSDDGLEPMSWGHVAGVLNEWADALSRLHAPDAKEVPVRLAAFEPEVVPERDGAWWRASRGTACLEKRVARGVRQGCRRRAAAGELESPAAE